MSKILTLCPRIVSCWQHREHGLECFTRLESQDACESDSDSNAQSTAKAAAVAEADLSRVCGSSAMRALREWQLISAAARAARRGEPVESHALELARAVLDDVRERRKAAHAGLVAALREGAEVELLQPTKLAVDSLHRHLRQTSAEMWETFERARDATQKAQAAGAAARLGGALNVAGRSAAAAAAAKSAKAEKKRTRESGAVEKGGAGASESAKASESDLPTSPRVLRNLVWPVAEGALARVAAATEALSDLSTGTEGLLRAICQKKWSWESSARAQELARDLELEQQRLAEHDVVAIPFKLPGVLSPANDSPASCCFGSHRGDSFWNGASASLSAARREHPAMTMLHELGVGVEGVAAALEAQILAGACAGPADAVVSATAAAEECAAHAEGLEASPETSAKRPRTREAVRGGASPHVAPPTPGSAAGSCAPTADGGAHPLPSHSAPCLGAGTPSLFVAAAVARANLAEAWQEIAQAAIKIVATKPVISEARKV